LNALVMADYVRRAAGMVLKGLDDCVFELIVGELEIVIENRDFDDAHGAVVELLIDAEYCASERAADKLCDKLFDALGFGLRNGTSDGEMGMLPSALSLESLPYEIHWLQYLPAPSLRSLAVVSSRFEGDVRKVLPRLSTADGINIQRRYEEEALARRRAENGLAYEKDAAFCNSKYKCSEAAGIISKAASAKARANSAPRRIKAGMPGQGWSSLVQSLGGIVFAAFMSALIWVYAKHKYQHIHQLR
jgi:hypothetical protein